MDHLFSFNGMPLPTFVVSTVMRRLPGLGQICEATLLDGWAEIGSGCPPIYYCPYSFLCNVKFLNLPTLAVRSASSLSHRTAWAWFKIILSREESKRSQTSRQIKVVASGDKSAVQDSI